MNRPYWGMVIEDERGIDFFLRGVNEISSPCNIDCWMRVPVMGLVFATLYQVALVILSWWGPCTCLPLFATPGSEPPSTVYDMALVGNQNHFVPVKTSSYPTLYTF